MSKNEKLTQAINSWSSGQCRDSIEDFSYLSITESDIKAAELSALKSQAEKAHATVEELAKNMYILDKFKVDCFMTQVVGVEFPFHNYPNANQDFLEDLVLYLKGEIPALNYADYL